VPPPDPPQPIAQTPAAQILAGRTVLVTGGNGGIGLAMAMACGRAGARIVLWGRNEGKNAEAIEALTAEGIAAHAFVCDVSDEAAVDATFAASIDAAGGRIDAVFANAGRGGTGTRFIDTSLADWRAVMQINLDGVFLTFRAAARHMIEAGGGSLVAISSTSAIHGAAGNEAYGTSKTALLGLVRALAVGLARHQIRVNALLPGWTLTEMAATGYASDKFRSITVGRTPVRRWADPSEMGPAAVFLADPTSTFHTGDTMTVDGGYTVF
jgi:NAD(P)-dependent dehydrogenase (short-subunit alcohol dehydrogenase family)